MELAVCIPCYNERESIVKVIQDFRKELPLARIIVFDNRSEDGSRELSENSGAEVKVVKTRGKGYVVQKIFEIVKADIYVIVDGDDTYFARDVYKLIDAVIKDDIDMAVGRRIAVSKGAMKKVNRIGNAFFSKLMSLFFGVKLHDVLSGYRVVNRQFIESVPLLRMGFEIESEMTLQALSKGMRIREIPVEYKERLQNSESKLSVIKDGYRILLSVVILFRDLKPLTFFSVISFVLWVCSVLYGVRIYYLPGVASFFETIVLISLFIVGWLFLLIGFVVHTINRRFSELNIVLRRNRKVDVNR